LTTLAVDRAPPWADIDRLMDDWRPAQLVVGVPEGDGAAAIARQARSFAAALAERYGLPVATVDETLTSVAAQGELAEGRRSGYLRRRVGRGSVDRLAACLIAEQWMNEQ
jgi:putative Holliday junction resolvase